MRLFSSSGFRAFIVYSVLMVFACLPIWTVADYYNQDGQPHLYNAYIINELFAGNPAFTGLYALNHAPLPNLSGHYLLSFLLFFFAPDAITKLLMTFTLAGFVAAIVWLRRQTVGADGLELTILLGTALAFNWMWFLGFYNFIIGAVGFAFTLGLYWRWRENLNLFRSLILSALLIAVYFSHLISFGMLAGGFVLIGICVAPPHLKRNLIWTTVIFLPIIPLLIGFKLLAAKGGEMSPVWHALENPYSVADWLRQMQIADPFQLLSRKALPFVAGTSNIYAVFTPFLWLTAAFVFLAAATFASRRRREIFSRPMIPFFLIGVLSIVFWVIAPDDFGKSHGGFLRERVLLCGLVCFVPLMRVENARLAGYAAAAMLSFVIIFQTATLWEYARFAENIGHEYLSGRSQISDSDSLAAIVLIKDGCRYKAAPLANLTTFYGIGNNTLIFDNYEMGYYQFPVVTKNPEMSRFIYDFREAAFFENCAPDDVSDGKFAALKSSVEANNDKISVMLVWDDDARIAPILSPFYESDPFYQNGRLRLFRHR